VSLPLFLAQAPPEAGFSGLMWVQNAIYIISASMFIEGIKEMNSPATARKGNLLSSFAMVLAVAVTFIDPHLLKPTMVAGSDAARAWLGSDAIRWGTVIGGTVVGSLIGYIMAKTVKMTDMPQAVAIFNGLGGGAAALVSAATYIGMAQGVKLAGSEESALSILIGTLIGSVTFTGSLIAFAKLQGIIGGKPIPFPRALQILFALGALGLAGYLLVPGEAGQLQLILFLVMWLSAMIFGIGLVLPVGGADMPVMISLLNSFTGTAAAFTGFVLSNNVLIIAGALVGASGFILTNLMCKAMNRSLMNVLFSNFGGGGGAAGAATEGGVEVETSVEDVAIMLAYAQQVIIVPGYGLAVAQAQHGVQKMAELLEKKGVQVKYAIHPVAGRMPGHMNVLLAEANVPYSSLYDMEDINPEFERADVALIIGANDVTNPAARNDPNSPIYGMPILDCDKAKNVIVMKRGRGKGYAGIENPLYFLPKTKMLFGDAKKTVSELVTAIEET
jgi:NAD(P) transhydrogenase subunit beta